MPLFDLFKKKTPQPKESTYKQKVIDFWDWYSVNAARLYEALDQGQSSTLVDEISDRVSLLSPSLGWVFGPGPDGDGHSFTITPEGDPHRSFLTNSWAEMAPELQGWTFYPNRQPSTDITGQSIVIHDEKFKPEEFWITPTINAENENIDIIAWHPLFKDLPENQMFRILFLWLDEVLGEQGTNDWIGAINFKDTNLKQAFPITELGEFVEGVCTDNEWKTKAPGKMFSVYKMDETRSGFLRADIFSGCSSHMRLMNEHLSSKGNMDDPLEGSGASFVFLSFNKTYLKKGDEVNMRGDIEECLDEVLLRNQSGQCIGGAIGTENAYIDLLILDGADSLALIREALTSFELPEGCAIYSFAGSSDTPLCVQ